MVLLPATLVVALGLSLLLRKPLSERWTAGLTQITGASGFLAALVILTLMLLTGQRSVPVEVGDWVSLPAVHFHFTFTLICDRLSIPFVIMTFVLCGVIGAFASRYLHREPGFGRFFLCFAVFQLGMVLSSVAGTIEALFFGWELVGLSSALLVAFFLDRSAPVRNGLRVWTIYRFADAAFLLAALTLHHLSGSGNFDALTGHGAWPEGQSVLDSSAALFVGGFLLIAAAAKSALVPFSGWLPRAMEGPTPSSAVFYGALSVHLGAFLLLRVGALLDQSLALQVLVTGLGLLTLLIAVPAGRVQTDIKSTLAFASLVQVSLIVVEIGLGLRYIPLIHIIGHACLRTLQLVRAPSLLKDFQATLNDLGPDAGRQTPAGTRTLPAWSTALYGLALNRGGLDVLLDEYLVRPFVSVFSFCDSLELRITSRFAGSASGPAANTPAMDDDSPSD
jgi:NAD(P)H-quinone oxidoreductase subunit 5